MVATIQLKGKFRTGKGTGAARAVRNEGNVPAVIYGKNSTEEFVSLPAKELMLEYVKGKFFAKIVEIEVDGKKFRTIPQDLQLHPVKDTPLHADFINLANVDKIRLTIPVEFTGADRSPGLKRGGVLNTVRRSVEVICNPNSIPEKFIADLGPLRIGDNIKFSNLLNTQDVTPVIKDRDFTIATVTGRKADNEDEAPAAGAALPTVGGKAQAPAAAKAPAKAPAKKK